jgi:hypothetical protein
MARSSKQGRLDVDLVLAQHHHVDVTMIADRPSYGELDRVPAGDVVIANRSTPGDKRGPVSSPHRR